MTNGSTTIQIRVLANRTSGMIGKIVGIVTLASAEGVSVCHYNRP